MEIKNIRYTAVVYSGSTCCCRALQHVSRGCGHLHKSEDAAEKCRQKNLSWSKNGRSCNADWYNSKIVERNTKGEALVWSRPDENGESELVTAASLCTC